MIMKPSTLIILKNFNDMGKFSQYNVNGKDKMKLYVTYTLDFEKNLSLQNLFRKVHIYQMLNLFLVGYLTDDTNFPFILAGVYQSF